MFVYALIILFKAFCIGQNMQHLMSRQYYLLYPLHVLFTGLIVFTKKHHLNDKPTPQGNW